MKTALWTKWTLWTGIMMILPVVAPANVIEIRGSFEHRQPGFPLELALPVPFVLTWEYDPAVGDRNPDDPTLGEYYSEGVVRLEFGGYLIESTGNEVEVYANHEGLSGFYVYNEWPIETGYGFTIPADGLYLGAVSPFIHGLFPNDSLDLVATTTGDPLWDSLAVTPYVVLSDGTALMDTDTPVHFSVQVPEPGVLALLALAGISVFRRSVFRSLASARSPKHRNTEPLKH